ncbi:hypothetical protein QCA50_016090 [Cerrena zonata]|uniref:Cytochrome P450 n=1 Tax=Cerrena zonata TaxID=2478898 RepID=A0AAW0FKV2_9APHY
MLAILLLCFFTICCIWKLLRLYTLPSPLDNVPGPPRQSWLKGNLAQFFDLYDWKFLDDICETFGSVVKIQGAFGDKFLSFLYVSDVKAIQTMIKNGDVYEENSVYLSLVSEVLGPGLAATTGHLHRRQRKMLSPAFSPHRLREMAPIIHGVAHRLQQGMLAQINSGATEVNIVPWMERAALEVIGQAGLGCSFDPLTEKADNVLGATAKAIIPALSALSYSRLLLPYMLKLGTPAIRSWIAARIPSRRLQHLRRLKKTLREEMSALFYAKKEAIKRGDEVILQDVGEGKDILSILLRANMNASETDRQTDEEVIAHMAILTFAAIDTSSTLLFIILELLSKRPDVQAKLRTEIIDRRQGSDPSFDELINLPYLHGVYCESLRLYPGAISIFRDVHSDTIMPLSSPVRGKDGKWMSEIHVPAGSAICVALRGCNTTKELWGEDAYEWKPERWLSPLPEAVLNANIPGVFPNLISFLGGERGCIGYRFAELEIKTILSVLIESFSFSQTDREIHWCKGDVRFPTMVKENNPRPCMFLKIEPCNAAA